MSDTYIGICSVCLEETDLASGIDMPICQECI